MDHAIGASSSCGEPSGAAPILIVGASARAAAQSAGRGGLEPWAADLFCDRDLIEACSHALRIEHYPHGVERVLAAAPPGPWMYTGALENHPELIDRIAAIRPLYGISGESLRAVRDPLRLAEAVRAAGFNAPRCSITPTGVPTDGSWLIKPLASAGGQRIEHYVGHAVRAGARDYYFQEKIEGLPASAVYIGHGRAAICLGVSRQLIRMPLCGTRHEDHGRFRYCGSIAPIDVSALLARRFEKLGSALAHTFTLRGLFGLDVIVQGDEIWPIELNPRSTASCEILERSLETSAVRLHCEAFFAQEETEGTEKPVAWALAHAKRWPAWANAQATRFHGKIILFAPEDLVVGESFLAWVERQNSGLVWPQIADVPASGSAIRAGQPIVTVFAAGPDEQAVFDGLKALAAEAYRNLAVSPP